MVQMKKKSDVEKEDGEAEFELEIELIDIIKYVIRKIGYNICQEKKIGQCFKYGK